MDVESQIVLNKFVPRDYQKEVFDAIENEGYRKLLWVAPRRCLSGQTHIIMSNGSYKLLKDIKQGDKILSWDGFKFVEDTVKNIWSTGVKKTKHVQSPGKIPIISSEDHRFASMHCGRDTVHWKTIGDLSQASTSTQVLHYAGLSYGSVDNPDLAEFLGYMTFDGYVVGYQQPKFTNNNREILDRVAYLGSKLFGYDPIWRPKGNGYDLGFTNGTKGGGYTPNAIKEIFRAEGLDVPKSSKSLLSMIWEFDERSLGRFLAAVISCDGSIYSHKEGFVAEDSKNSIPPGNEVTFNCGSSDQLGWDIYWLLRRMGIVPQVPYKERGSNWKIRVSKSDDLKKLLSYGPIYGKQDKQNIILERVSTTTKKVTKWKGCYRSRITIKDHSEEELYDIEVENNHNFVANGYVVHNCGKDITLWNIAIRQCLKRICLVFYCLPTYSQARKCIFDAIAIDGTKFLDFIPKKLVESINISEMKIRFKNGSILQCIGAESYETSLVGTNPYAVILSEFGPMNNNDVYPTIRPILAANGGWVAICSTPRGKNCLWHLWKVAQELTDWHVLHQKTSEIKHISDEIMAQERAQMDEGLYLQEYECSFERGIEGSYYGRCLDELRLRGQITSVPWEPGLLVHVSMDIGVNDATTIIWFQVVGDGSVIRIIDCYSNNNLGLDHYAKILQDKPYRYGKYFAPHDIKVREWGGGAITRYEKARQLGIEFIVLEQTGLMDGIECVWTNFSKFWIDQEKCRSLINALENYRKEWNEPKQMYDNKPVKSWANHYSDALRYLCQSLHKTKKGLTSEEFERKKAEALYGNRLPGIFNYNPDYDRLR